MRGHGVPDPELAVRLAMEYAAAHYFVSIGHREWLFGVGQRAGDIERELDAEHYLFITAWNPAPHFLDAEANQAADQRLRDHLEEAGYRHHSAIGSDGRGGAVEHGWMVLDVPLASGDAMAREFAQAGTLYWRRGDPVRLRMMYPRPAAASDDPHVDWAG